DNLANHALVRLDLPLIRASSPERTDPRRNPTQEGEYEKKDDVVCLFRDSLSGLSAVASTGGEGKAVSLYIRCAVERSARPVGRHGQVGRAGQIRARQTGRRWYAHRVRRLHQPHSPGRRTHARDLV